MHACMAAGVSPPYPCTLAAEFKRPTLLPAKLQLAAHAERDLQGCTGGAWPAGGRLEFAVLTSDGGKEVLTGCLSAGAGAGGKQQ